MYRPRPEAIRHQEDYNIVISSASPRSEPTTHWNFSTRGFETNLLRRQMDSRRFTTMERDIFDLSKDSVLKEVNKIRSKWQISEDLILQPLLNSNASAEATRNYSNNFMSSMNPDGSPPYAVANVFPSRNSDFGIIYCLSCYGSNPETLDTTPYHVSLFYDTLLSTGSPSLAIQTHLTTLLRMSYYSGMPVFDANATASVAYFEKSLVPVSRSGYFSLLGIIALHLGLFAIVGYLFITKTKFTMLGNSWHTFTQVARNKTIREMMRNRELRTDEEVEKWVKSVEADKTKYKIEWMEDGGGMCLVAVDK